MILRNLQRQYIETEDTTENQDRMALAIQSIRRERAQEYQRRFEQEGDEINADAERLDAEPTTSDESNEYLEFEVATAEIAEPLFDQYLNATIPSSEVQRRVQSAIIDYADTNRLSSGDLRRLAGVTNMYRNIVPADADSADPSVTQFQDAYAEGYRGAIREVDSQEQAAERRAENQRRDREDIDPDRGMTRDQFIEILEIFDRAEARSYAK